ncbi:signal peptidase I [Chitinilyticum litopenaei]|uniref:signal peptidase I n=1 Tax=Chitinilyticum litopenaei TaxID=1121276 RepID=UPI0005B851F5|nr:signal peptidase I [Chitinilyticum litopenaei]
MNWMLVGAILLVIAPVLIAIGQKQERVKDEPPQLVQYGYLSALAGLFVLAVQFTTIAAAFLIFVILFAVIWALDKFVLEKKRAADEHAPAWAEIGRGFFPVFLLVFVLRAFVAEPYQIPSSSMRPGLVVGDFILVNKFAYGLRVPVLNSVFIPVGKPEHGDVMVFYYPVQPEVNYIKRVVGLPGDTVEYRNKRLSINGKPVPTKSLGEHQYVEQGVYQVNNQMYQEQAGAHTYRTLQMQEAPVISLAQVSDGFPFRENCRYDEDGFVCKVPDGHYFMMGDNRDHSADSRYWGFVPEKYVVGRASLVWLNLRDLSRIGTWID